MAYAIINIGSNLGNRRLNLRRAVRAISMAFGDFEASHTVESKSWGYDSPNKFLNMALMVRTDLEPQKVLDTLLDIQDSICADAHRTDDGSYADRVIDIDLIAIDDVVMDTPRLTLPHPRMAERRFVLQPMAEIAGAWTPPLTGLSVMEMLANLPEDDE